MWWRPAGMWRPSRRSATSSSRCGSGLGSDDDTAPEIEPRQQAGDRPAVEPVVEDVLDAAEGERVQRTLVPQCPPARIEEQDRADRHHADEDRDVARLVLGIERRKAV